MTVVDAIAAVLLLAGAGLTVIAGIGLVRFDGLFARMHAATKAATLGLTLVFLGTMLRVESADAVAKLVLVLALQFVTAPIGAHLVGRAAYQRGAAATATDGVDDLADRDRESPPTA